MQAEKIEKLLAWGNSFGAELSSGLQFEFDESEGIRCICTENVDCPAVRIPQDLIIHRGLITSAFPGLKIEQEDSNTWLKFLLAKLMYDTHDASSQGLREKFLPYLECLPAVVDSPLIWNPRELELLQGTNLGSSLRAKLRAIFREWYGIINKNEIFPKDAISDDLKLYREFEDVDNETIYDTLLADTINRSPKAWYSFSAFLWSHLIFVSRAFPEYVIDCECESTSVILLPIIDLLNHDFSSKVEWSSAGGGFIFRCLSSVSEGHQLYNNYGGKGNEELLSGYGFLLKENPFSSVALKIKLPLDQIAKILEEGINLPTMDDYTTYAFEKKEADVFDATADHPELAFTNGITYLISKMNDTALNDMLNLFAYMSKSEDQKWDELVSLFKGLQSLRVALKHKLQDVSGEPETSITTTNFEINSSRKHYAAVYRADQVSILKHALARLKSIEKKWMTENKNSLLTMKKILKYDPSFIDEELPLFFGSKSCEEIVFPGTLQFLALWVLVKLQKNSFTAKYQWVQNSFQNYESTHPESEPPTVDEDAELFYADLIAQNQAQEKVSLRDARTAFHFLSLNTFTRMASTDQETILVKR